MTASLMPTLLSLDIPDIIWVSSLEMKRAMPRQGTNEVKLLG